MPTISSDPTTESVRKPTHMASHDLPDNERPHFPDGFKRTCGRYSKPGDGQYLLDTSIAWALHGYLQKKDPTNAALNMVLWHQIVGLGGDPGTTFNIPLSTLRSRGIDNHAIEKSLEFLMQLGILVYAWTEPPSKAVVRIALGDFHDIARAIPAELWRELDEHDKKGVAEFGGKPMLSEPVEFYITATFASYHAQFLSDRPQ